MRREWVIVLVVLLSAPALLALYLPPLEVFPPLRLSFNTGPCGVYEKVVQTAFLDPRGERLFPYLSGVYADRPRVVHLLDTRGTRPEGALGLYFHGMPAVKEKMPSVPESLWAAFAAAGKETTTHDCTFGIPMTVSYISPEEVEELYQGTLDLWTRFYERYPDSRGIMTLTDIVFGPKGLDALVLIGIQSEGTQGAGYFAYLRREDGTWTVKEAAQAWVS